ncbi:hypothetical protein, variant [Aphanomyces astaci]|uniref:UDP-N-acetylglucosamine--peptide N-acetylglucosaminyltransferase SPINDLY n=1 Tax=Aphanomyces astaci TaxID=112090 RepID=W4H0J3_APHAT|nr:hypothetical protein, variant [Aphanomyces astaci]ETV85525.1 hypothetical protein, variant [Aphanomyces astaci]|eukprot:XP_009825543.1 hypothetical protein, variant [Aphanomyces astaci]
MHALLGESSLALDLWTKCLRQDPKFLVAHFLKGSLRAQQCLPDLALAEFLTVRNQLPAYPHVQMSIGYCYYLQGNVKRAVVELTEALAQHPADTDAWYTRGVCLQELLALPTAILDFGRVVALQPTHWRAWYQIGGALRYFESIVSIKDTYVSPAIEAMIDLHKCKDARSIDEKVFLCHQLLSQRAVRFNEVYMLPFEGYKDMSACIAYYPHDMDMYWYRGHLHQRYHNYDAAIDDLTSCILLTLHLGKPKGVHLQRYKKMVLARATLYTHEMQWELALDDLNEVLHYALKDNHVETSFLLHVYDKRCKVLVALKQYDAAIVEMESVLELSKDHVEWNDNSLVNMLLLANLHCHAAIEFQKRHQVGMYTTWRMHALLGESSLALDLWTKCLRQDPKFLVAHFLKGSLRAQQCLPDLALAEFLTRGMCHLLLKDYTSALYDFGKAAPHLRDGHAAVGYIHFCRKMYPDAIDAYSKFLDERSNDAKVLLYRGFSLYMHNERSLAMRDFEKALKVDAACWFGHFIRAFIYQEQGHGDKAMAAIGQCIDQFKHVRPFADTIEPVHSDRANPFFDGRLDVTLDKLKGLILPQPRNNKQYPQSNASPPLIGGTTAAAGDHRRRLRAMFLRAVRRVLFQSRVVFALEKCAFKATSASITLSKQLDKLTEMHPISPPQGTFTPDSVAWAYNLMGVLSASQFKWEEALRNFTMAIRAAPTKPIPHLNRGNVYMQMNAIDKALHEFREALKVDPTHAATMTNTALALRQLGQLEEACRHLYTAATQADDKPSTDQHRQLVYYALANVIRELNRNDEAIEWYTKAAAAMDTSSQDTTQTRMDHVKLAVYHNRGSTMHTQLKFKRALDDYSMALALQPQSFATRMNRAALFISTSKCYQAIQDLRVATSLNRDSATGHRLLRFCERWASALKVACHDFFYAFHAFPCFHDIDIASTTPFLDLHMFRFQQLSHPNHPSLEALEAMLNASESPDFPDMMWDALVHTQRGNFADAQRALLIAKYSTGTSVAEEQACLVWSAQIAHHLGDIPTAIASVEQALQRGRTTSSSSAITAPNHVASDVRGGGIPAEEPRRDTDDDQVQSIQSDLETYLGCLWRLHGHVVDATSAFQRAIAHRPSNFIALFNAASVYLHEGNYSCMLDVLFQIINVTVHALDKLDKPIVPTIPTSTAPFLYMPHDFATTFSRVSVLAGPTVLPVRCCW